MKNRKAAMTFLLLLPVALSGCGGGGDAQRAKRINSANKMKQLTLSIVNYWESNNEWPDNLDQIKDLMGDADPDWLKNPLTGDNPGYEYIKPTESKLDAEVVLIYQLHDGQRDLTLAVGFADSSVRPLKTHIRRGEQKR